MNIGRKNPQFPLSVLNLPSKNALIQTPSPNPHYSLYHVGGQKNCIEVYRIQVEKNKLAANLEIYQWRHRTQFPIAKTKYIRIQPNHIQMYHMVELIVFNQHCPLKLNRMYEMTMAQTLYMLKQAMIGFERLYNKFGAFEVTESMIGINEKGACRVWLNENFSINWFANPEVNQQKMVAAICQIMERHCKQTKTTKKFFAKLKQARTFLSALKEIDSFVICSKVLVPSRYILNSSLKQIPLRLDIFNSFENKAPRHECISQPYIRNSIKSNSLKKKLREDTFQVETIKFSSNSPSEIKRFKSEDKMRVANNMKISDGETAYTRNIKGSNTGYYNTPKAIKTQKNISDNSRNQGSKWLQESSFTIELENNKNKKDKKQLSHSQAVISLNESSQKKLIGKNRKLSTNMKSADNYKFQGNIKKSQYQSYAREFNEILADNETPSTPRKRNMGEIEEQKLRDEHTQSIMKNNGWNGLTGFMDIPKKGMKQSYHEGQQQMSPKHQLKLQKLDSIGRRPILMSILPQQYEDII